MTNTVYDVIDTGVHYLLNMYEDWKIEDVLDKDSDVFPNNLHWQMGHVLTVFENALSKGDQNVVDLDLYIKLFAPGSKPADWSNIDGDVPNIESILNDIKTIPERARKLTDEQLAIELDQPIAGFSTVEGLLMLNAIHIPLHAGKMEEMTRVLKNN